MTRPRRDPRERYGEKVATGGLDECWPWTAFRNPCGYGMFTVQRGETRLAHRWAYEEFVGPIPPGMCVCHTCDFPACQNPRHWFLGTPGDNSRDKVAKGRQRAGGLPGASNSGAKLTEDQVVEIRRLRVAGWTQDALAARFSISQTQVGRIVRGERWAS